MSGQLSRLFLCRSSLLYTRSIHTTRACLKDKAVTGGKPGATTSGTDTLAPSGMDKWKRPTSMNSRQNPKSGQQQQKQQQQQRSSPKATDTGAKQGNRPTTNSNNSGRTMPTKRNWTKPVDHHAEKHEGESAKRHERHINKFSKPPREGETVTQRKERKRKEEELANIMKQEAAAKRHMEQRQAKQRAKELAEKENRVRDVFIPEIVNVANLSKILGIRIGMSVRQQEKDLYINLCL